MATLQDGEVAQLVERVVRNDEVGSSILLFSTTSPRDQNACGLPIGVSVDTLRNAIENFDLLYMRSPASLEPLISTWLTLHEGSAKQQHNSNLTDCNFPLSRIFTLQAGTKEWLIQLGGFQIHATKVS